MPTLQPATWQHVIAQLQLPQPDSHKGQNGKLLVIGGSELFHAASKWSLDAAAKFVDMVFYASEPSNNILVQEAKGQFWNGIVIERSQIDQYLEEADVCLLGPGMERVPATADLTNSLLKKYPHKRWVLDAGALQMLDPELLTDRCIVTPHTGELQLLMDHLGATFIPPATADQLAPLLAKGVTIIVKGSSDQIFYDEEVVTVTGGNAGMTKGGTGDVLAGLIAALYCTHPAANATIIGSYINKLAGESLYQRVGPFFNASDLVAEIPAVLWSEYQQHHA